jgi:exodeoxyribonuclease V gamma subunit
MALHVHRAERTDVLADGLGTLLATPPADPFAEDLVVVPARGVERWLSQRLSHLLGRGAAADGVCAGVVFRSPASLISEIAGTREDDPWSPEAMTWPLLEVIDAHLDDPWCRTLATHLGHFADGDEKELRQGRRYAVARRLAGLFASYARQRPRLLASWLDGDSAGLDADLAWQPELWRRLVEAMAIDPPHVRHAKTVARLQESACELPDRISLFGYTRLSATDIELLDALSTHHEVHLWLPHPSVNLWTALSDLHGTIPRRDDESHLRVDHPLLATLGRDLRELQRSLPPGRDTDEFLSAGPRPDTLLGWLQSDIAANAPAPPGRSLHPEDRSVQVHSCHGPARQIEVLREVLLGLLADDRTLEPRDILVMCPDIETYAPLIAADFGLGEVVPGAHPAHRLRVRLADRSLVQTNPLLALTAQLLSLASSRVTATEVLNIAHAGPVRDRFDFTDDDLENITTWVKQSNIRWGLDREHRTPFGVDFIQNTWQFGVDRILAGVAMSDDSQTWIATTLPLDDVGSNRVELAGRLAEFVTRLRAAVNALTGTRTLKEWLTALTESLVQIARVAHDDAWQLSQLQREFNEVLRRAGDRADTALRLTDVHALLAGQFAGRPTRANFRTGTLTVCTMVPMRSVPHRVVCLVGLDDTVFPRLGSPDGDDALSRDPMTGERDIRSEDRQLLLDAVCAATEKLVITYTGANEYTGKERPPAVPLMELLDALDTTTEAQVRGHVVTRHPLQPFDIKNVRPGALGVPGQPFSFDATALSAAIAMAGDRPAQPEFFAAPLPERPAGDVGLAELLTFYRDPIRGFFTELEFALPRDFDGIDDAMPVEVDNLQQWVVGDRMLTDIVAGMDPQQARQAEWRRGLLPPGWLGCHIVNELRDQAMQLATAAAHYRLGDPQAHDVDVDLGNGRRLTGTVSQVFGERTVALTFSKLGGQHLLAAWIPLLALTAAMPERDWSAVCIGRAVKGEGLAQRSLGRPQEDPRGVLRTLVEMFDTGRREPLPLPIKTSYAWAAARFALATGNYYRKPPSPHGEARAKWKFEREEPAVQRIWGYEPELEVLLTPPSPPEEVDGESTRLGACAARLWLPMLHAEGTI